MEQEIQTVRERLAASDEQPLAMVQSFGCQLMGTDALKEQLRTWDSSSEGADWTVSRRI